MEQGADLWVAEVEAVRRSLDEASLYHRAGAHDDARPYLLCAQDALSVLIAATDVAAGHADTCRWQAAVDRAIARGRAATS